jgi:hypothetical protein
MADAPPPPAVQAARRKSDDEIQATLYFHAPENKQASKQAGGRATGRLTVANGRDPHPSTLAAQHIQQGDHEARPAGANGVTNGHRPAKHIHPAGRHKSRKQRFVSSTWGMKAGSKAAA